MADRDQFDEFIVARSQRLLSMAYLLTRNWANAEDLLQDAMAKAWFAWSRLSGDPEAYVRKIIVTTFISNARRRWRRELVTADVPQSPDLRDPMGPADDRDAMWRALGRLPPRQRAVVVMRYYADLPEAEVAELLRCSIGTVKSQTAKALAKLRTDATLTPAPQSGRK